MSIFSETLQSGLAALDITLDAATPGKLEHHWRLVCEYNQRFNLTAITDDAEAALKHYLDCLLLLPVLRELQAGGHIGPPLQAADIGSGAGFPGLVLALAGPELEWLLLEANNKKCGFLEQCIKALPIENARALPLRAELAGHAADLRGRCNVVTARAVSSLAVLLEYSMPLLAEGGLFMALKGPALEEEEQKAANALAVLGGQPAGRWEYTLPGGDKRVIACYRKISPTPEKYPRRAGMPEKRPL